MTTPTPHTTGETLEQLLDRVVFENPDPRVQRLKAIWENAKREAEDLFERASAEQYEDRLDCYRTCGESNAEELAQRDAGLLRLLLREEKEKRLTAIWTDILRRVEAVLADTNAKSEQTPDSGSVGGTAGSSGT